MACKQPEKEAGKQPGAISPTVHHQGLRLPLRKIRLTAARDFTLLPNSRSPAEALVNNHSPASFSGQGLLIILSVIASPSAALRINSAKQSLLPLKRLLRPAALATTKGPVSAVEGLEKAVEQVPAVSPGMDPFYHGIWDFFSHQMSDPHRLEFL